MGDPKVKIPDFLMEKNSEEDIPEVWRLLREYDERFGADFTTEGLPMGLEEMADILKICLKENRSFDDVWGAGELDEDDFI
ncbi:MAG: hypothetical protein HFG77_18280 [Hungatella sp.]|jgi:hypothetical protein|nr:hypothetical protein [Hungatella sp.]